jgi:antirestriction protein ArdC
MANIDEKFLSAFTSLMIDKIKSLTEDWRQPWINLKTNGTPQNIEGKHYKGINSLLLYMITEKNKYELPAFLTFNQAKANGLNINKGASSFPVVYWNFSVKDKDTGDKISIDQYRNLSEGEKKQYTVMPFMKHYNVFNIAQTNIQEVKPELYQTVKDRYKIPELKDDKGMFVSVPLDNFLKNQSWIVPIYSLNQDKAYYTPGNASVEEKIVIPLKAQFNSGESFYSTMMHEMAHSTGNKLNRDMSGYFGSDKYAKEELVAELTAAVSSASIGINTQIKEENAQYLKGWLEQIGENPKFLFGILTDVNKASNMILDKIGNEAKLDKKEIKTKNIHQTNTFSINAKEVKIDISPFIMDTYNLLPEEIENLKNGKTIYAFGEDAVSGQEYESFLKMNPKTGWVTDDRSGVGIQSWMFNEWSKLHQKEIIGKISFYGYDGNVGEVMEYADKESYLNAIKKEMDYNPNGFKYHTLTSDPEVRKSVDDIIYGAYGADNPHGLDYYDNQTNSDRENNQEHSTYPDDLDPFWQAVEDHWFPDDKKFWDKTESRISDINIFSLKNGGYAIRCKIDGEQQSAEKMSREDVINFTDKTDRKELAAKYFAPALLDNSRETNKSLKL